MKKLLITFIALNVVAGALVVGVLAGMLFLAETTPFDYASPFYSVQTTAEAWRLRLGRDELRRADFALKLVDRRLADLGRATDAAEVADAASAVSASLDDAIRNIGAAPIAEQEGLFTRLDQLLAQAEIILAALEPGTDAPAVVALSRKVAELTAVETREELVARTPAATTIAAEIIPFLGKQVDHDIYPLEGAHANVECESCHTNGTYKDTPTECSDCHALTANGIYPTHFQGECTDCHTIESWEPFRFDHAIVRECESCHVGDTPDDHYEPPAVSINFLASISLRPSRAPQAPPVEDIHFDTCIRCHTDTTDWNNAAFDHFGFKDCAACHEEMDTPEDHYPGQCSACHNVIAWDDAWFNHTGFPDCQSCHTPDGTHFPGECSDCHTTVDWTRVSYTHVEGSDCTTCHAGEKPAEHYNGACDNCHTTVDWRQIDFDHTGLNDCASCHSKSNHYSGQCSSCHNTENWANVAFNHTGMSNCEGCHGSVAPPDHYGGGCASCHTTDNWRNVTLDHSNLAGCVDCHSSDVPSGHYGGSCATCHNTRDWQQIVYNHAGARECVSCHGDEKPSADHYSDECAACHTINAWQEADYPHISSPACTTCHADDRPSKHVMGECSDCHTADSWAFVHLVLNNCASCHTKTKHWPGECSNCHTSTVDWLVYTFDHTGYDNCKACHTPPSGHPRGQCSKCHTTDGWDTTTADPAAQDIPVPLAAPPRPGSSVDEPAPPPPLPVPLPGPSR